MIALDTSSVIAYLSGDEGSDVDAAGYALQSRQAALPPVVLSELLSDPTIGRDVRHLFIELPLLDVIDGYWQRAGLLRATTIAKGRKARLADVLIAQSCLDHRVPLVTRDADFRNLARATGLRLLPGPSRRA